ncbi:MAG TPA: HD domain-containing protein [Acidimicrobiales bacterium]|nr:HD domain-containing protein [Acidimicrobiales bacterium]
MTGAATSIADGATFDPSVPFTGPKGRSMAEFSPEYMAYLDQFVAYDLTFVPDRILNQLRLLEPIREGLEVNQLEHCLQTATRAERDGAELDLVVAAVLHDVGKTISNSNHPAIAAEMMRPWISEECYWVVKVHQDFQGIHYFARMGLDPMMRRRHADHPYYELAERFVDEWDNKAFDPDYDTLPLEHFEPMIREVFSRPPRRPGT